MNDLDELITEDFEHKVLIQKLRKQLNFLIDLLGQAPPEISPEPFYKYITAPQELADSFRAISLDLILQLQAKLKSNPERFSSKLLREKLIEKIASSDPDFTAADFLEPGFADNKVTLHFKESLVYELFSLAKAHFNYEAANTIKNLNLTQDQWNLFFDFMFNMNYRTPESLDIQPAIDAYLNITTELKISIETLRIVTQILIDYFEHLMLATTEASYYFTSDTQSNVFIRFNNFFGVLSMFIYD